MKTIDNYILERLNPGHLGKPRFPINGTIKDMIEFLEDNGFHDIQVTSLLNQKYAEEYDEHKNKCYSVIFYNPNRYAGILFADTSNGEISDKNPMYSIKFVYKLSSKNNRVVFITRYSSKSNSSEISSSDFIKETKKYF
jgi:hypothetical protein